MCTACCVTFRNIWDVEHLDDHLGGLDCGIVQKEAKLNDNAVNLCQQKLRLE